MLTHRARPRHWFVAVTLGLLAACGGDTSSPTATATTTVTAASPAASPTVPAPSGPAPSGPAPAGVAPSGPAASASHTGAAPTPVGQPVRIGIEVIATYPHDPTAFTQGLLLDDGRLFESTGLVGQSSVREVDLTTGRVLRRLDVGEGFFAEGLAAVDDRLIQLTWQSGVALVHDRDSFAPLGRFTYAGEGWGLCNDGRRLVMSDGSARLTFRDPRTFAPTGQVDVVDGDGTPVTRLNELECVGGDVYANVWLTDRIARIDPEQGRVTGWIDAAALRPADAGPQDVLNGIAVDERDGTFLVTGKRWPVLYRVRLTS